MYVCAASESGGGLYDEEHEEDEEHSWGQAKDNEKHKEDLMEVDELIQEELGGWTTVKPHTEKEAEPKVQYISYNETIV